MSQDRQQVVADVSGVRESSATRQTAQNRASIFKLASLILNCIPDTIRAFQLLYIYAGCGVEAHHQSQAMGKHYALNLPIPLTTLQQHSHSIEHLPLTIATLGQV